jgi:hypothetical protein
MAAPASVLGPAGSVGLGGGAGTPKNKPAVSNLKPTPVPTATPTPASTPTPGPTPTPSSSNVLNNFELSLTSRDIQQFQTAACMTPTGADNLGPLGSDTRLAIQKVLGGTDQRVTDRKATLLRARLKDGHLRDGLTCSPPG